MSTSGVAAAVQIGTAANEVMHDSWPARAAAVLGFAALLAVGWWQAARLRRDQGVAISGLMDSVVLGVDHAASFVYAAAFAIALVAAAGDRWVLVVGASVLGGVGYALAGRRWFERYRADPAASAQGLSPALTSAVAAVAVIGVIVLAALAR